ncbi:unnamed protein product [Adineta ricciae]|uniref:Uncharacterized protein n=1 Tax=Adineta ricciae TaxID=249248 RepID=A0A815ZEF5_ADIRI|nr:unnamed protein product [Adineta ricciae]
MTVISIILFLLILPCVDVTIYVYNTVDSNSVEFYDCILHDGLFYCRRPNEPMILNRSNDTMQCYHNGTRHLLSKMYSDKIKISTVLHEWKSSIEMVEQYVRYMNNREKVDQYMCECITFQSFGKNCEYLLPIGRIFAETLSAENSLKRYYPRYNQRYGNIVYYRTLECNSGLLHLDWRDICDDIQQCMSGLDEINCDLLEYNECEDDEYRCMNGMCIPEEYFLDGEFDCLDWSDEVQYYDDTNCPIESASIQCDDRICPPSQWSCGDGQCITDRFEFQKLSQIKSECRSRREQYFICETHYVRPMWTLPTGRCNDGMEYEESNVNNYTSSKRCEYLLKCALSKGAEKNCPCKNFFSCAQEILTICPSPYIQYPAGALMTPYILFFYNRKRNSSYSSVRPDFSWINGTIKCDGIRTDISGRRFSNITTIEQMTDSLCRYLKNQSVFNNYTYDQSCYNQSLTFNNRPYSSSKICNKSEKCLSTYRIKDGFVNCFDQMDEIEDISTFNICSSQHRRYRFRCFNNESTCLSIITLGNNRIDCKNKFDELWFGTNIKLANINCNKIWKYECESLRQYVEQSWLLSTTSEHIQHFRIPFRQYCDTFWNLALKEDENIDECKKWWVCTDQQWQCHTGQCIDPLWVLDGQWDCPDASDEDNLLFYSSNSKRNLQLVNESELNKRFKKHNKSLPFSTICNLTTHFPCYSVNISDPLDNLIYNRLCIRRDQIGDGHIDCYGAIDERNTIAHCEQTTMLGYNFKCSSNDQCIPYWDHCFGDRCKIDSDDQIWCEFRQNLTDYDSLSDALCFNGTWIKNTRCNRISDCLYGEDEYMCEYQNISKLTGVPYRKDKEKNTTSVAYILGAIRFPLNSNITQSVTGSVSVTLPTISTNLTASPIAYRCNRGVGIKVHNGSIACFCPPQYYGDTCQFHTDRIIVLLHLNLSQSIYTVNSDVNIVLKMIVLFVFNDEIITNHVFHVRPSSEMFIYTKKMIHFLYSRSSSLLQHKIQRYFNRSNIVDNHPYSIRIEMYERQKSYEPLLIAVWKYPIYFDFLPVFRLAKVLHLTKLNFKQNTCSSNPCNPHQDCQPLQNDQTKYICLCKSHFKGENCSIVDQQCLDNYCMNGSLCKPNYRGILIGNSLPYCICLFDYFGDQCEIRHDRCRLTPCLNNGSCYATSKPDTIACSCTEGYYGKHCELPKPQIKLLIDEMINHDGAVIQYFDIDFLSLNLILVRQQVYRTVPTLIEYRHNQKTIPEIIVAKVYSNQIDNSAELYLLSVHVNVTSIYAITQIIEQNRCAHLHTLISKNETERNLNYSPIKYHRLCQINVNLVCFHDGFYLCICDENHNRTECFRYDDKLDHCTYCLAGGRCVKGDPLQLNDFICICPACHSGTKCQFNSNSFGFTLDQLFFADLTSNNQKITFRLLIILPLLLFLLALPNNIFSFLTFHRPNCLHNGIGQYLLYMSIINKLNLGMLVARLIHLTIQTTALHSHPLIDHYFCKICSYLLTSSSRMVYWLSSLIAIERVYMILFLNRRWLCKPHIARRLIVLTFTGILISDIPELLFTKSLSGIHNDGGGMCIIEFSISTRSIWLMYHRIISVINSILPLLINICCTLTISCVVTKKKMNTRTIIAHTGIETKHQNESILVNYRNYLQFVFNVLSDNKELIIGPSITLVPQLFSLPLFIISFTLYCQNLENSQMRYLLIVSYFTSFIPQIISFMLYIFPSSFYSTEWHATRIGRSISAFFPVNRPTIPTITITATPKE